MTDSTPMTRALCCGSRRCESEERVKLLTAGGFEVSRGCESAGVIARAASLAKAFDVETLARVLCCGKDHCDAARHADGESPDRYASRNCEGDEITKQAKRVHAFMFGGRAP